MFHDKVQISSKFSNLVIARFKDLAFPRDEARTILIGSASKILGARNIIGRKGGCQ